MLFIFHKGLADYYRKIFTLLGEMRSKDGCQYPARENSEGLLPLAPAIICCMCLCVQEKKNQYLPLTHRIHYDMNV